ncbi:MAG: MFS transporter [Sphingomonadales bacterium]|nr:MFS transporter [Sphingomonadales bacterium]MDE2170612.1 MFS transporter [Sphingomonadales bacterium]
MGLHRRWWVVGLIALGTVFNYLARSTLATVAPTLKQQFAMTTEQYSFIVMAFQAAYTVAQPIAGQCLDLLGTRLGMALFAGAWALANMGHALASSWQGLALARAALGGAEASAMPGGLKVVAEWFPPRERSIATGWFNMGASLGNMLAPPLVAFCIIAWGWRSSFVVTGGLSLAWAVGWYVLYRTPKTPAADDPRQAATAPGWGAIVTDRAFWAIALPRFLAEPAWQTFNFFIPLYLASVWHLDLAHIALWAWSPFLAADVGSVAGGYLAARLMRSGVSLVASRQIVVALGCLLMLGPACMGYAPDVTWAIALFCVGGFAHQMLSGALLTLAADLFVPTAVGRVSGLAGAAAWIGGLLFTLLIGQSADAFGYTPLFFALGGLDLLAASALYVVLRPRRSRLAPELDATVKP